MLVTPPNSEYFNSRLRTGGDYDEFAALLLLYIISTHASAREATA